MANRTGRHLERRSPGVTNSGQPDLKESEARLQAPGRRIGSPGKNEPILFGTGIGFKFGELARFVQKRRRRNVDRSGNREDGAFQVELDAAVFSFRRNFGRAAERRGDPWLTNPLLRFAKLHAATALSQNGSGEHGQEKKS